MGRKKKVTDEVTEIKKKEVTPEEQVHLDARDARVKTVQAAIDAAKVARDEQEKLGLVETEGAKLDREAKEEADLKEAAVLNKIEPFAIESNNQEFRVLSEKVLEIINYLNHAK